MSSKEAQLKYDGEFKSYRAAEGKSTFIPYKGPVDVTVQQILGGLRSACAYVGTDKLKNLSKCTTFVRVNRTHNKIYGE
jgi:GMP reductase